MLELQEELLKQANIEEIAKKGAAIYEKIKTDYEPSSSGDFLAIDVGTEKAYRAQTSSAAVELARAAHPNTIFYVVRIGHSATEILARMSASYADRENNQ